MSAPGMHIHPDGSEFDLWAEAHKPVVAEVWKTFHITLPSAVRRKLAEEGCKQYPWIYINVDSFGVVQIDMSRSHWFRENTLKASQVRRIIYDWLSEWELVCLHPIGPEDHEWFVTEEFEKMVGESWGINA